jgi:Rho-binding antiterminator
MNDKLNHPLNQNIGKTRKSDYIPIDCELYSQYELAIIRRQRLRVAWRDTTGNCYLQALLPVNLQTRDGAEFLLARTTRGKLLELRLDRIIASRPLAAPAAAQRY